MVRTQARVGLFLLWTAGYLVASLMVMLPFMANGCSLADGGMACSAAQRINLSIIAAGEATLYVVLTFLMFRRSL